MKLHNPEAAVKPATKVEEAPKKDAVKPAEKSAQAAKDTKTKLATSAKVEEKKEEKKQEKLTEKHAEAKKEEKLNLTKLSGDDKKTIILAEESKKNNQQKPEKDSNWLKNSFKSVKDFSKKVSTDFKKIFLAQVDAENMNNQEKMF